MRRSCYFRLISDYIKSVFSVSSCQFHDDLKQWGDSLVRWFLRRSEGVQQHVHVCCVKVLPCPKVWDIQCPFFRFWGFQKKKKNSKLTALQVVSNPKERNIKSSIYRCYSNRTNISWVWWFGNHFNPPMKWRWSIKDNIWNVDSDFFFLNLINLSYWKI